MTLLRLFIVLVHSPLHGIFRSPQPFLYFGLGLVAVALIGGLAQAAAQRVGIPLIVFLTRVGVFAVILTVIWAAFWRKG